MKKPPIRRSCTRGVVAVEFALVLMPMIMLATGVAEFGRAIYQYETLTKATRDAARYLSVWLPTDSAYPVSQAQCLVVYGSTTCGSSGTELVPGLTTSMVTICDAQRTTGCSDASDPSQFANLPTYDSNNNAASGTATGAINVVEVKISGYQYQPIPAYPWLPSITFGNIVTVMRQVS
ncbi:pilus assembly protein [Burkholderia cenocepacia]|uniref:TadE/TadG family type IV pilus assembly protein n=1 Tax=Burkholderia cepacia complex TaxID=87882 RepID=UPI000F576B77|nr:MULTISPECIES: TadE/TadG family type IV pilus assembly protein [Burkholderia cepacia complex]ELW9447628.1 pilus assembly protein [Burkholderia cenocepacia]MBR8484230.1 pilus assembly protein [Burkholderia cenocepacia]MDN7468371.1 TadE/TadG family type IV pilus assembly protein [Burkholderia orbicola]MDN7501554.1 TadE/TadG family type IV pilus assembly protein [Burkholderia orbicola]RQU18298.1 pilus assembly protein [Burkholderia cenocepacia]